MAASFVAYQSPWPWFIPRFWTHLCRLTETGTLFGLHSDARSFKNVGRFCHWKEDTCVHLRQTALKNSILVKRFGLKNSRKMHGFERFKLGSFPRHQRAKGSQIHHSETAVALAKSPLCAACLIGCSLICSVCLNPQRISGSRNNGSAKSSLH